MDEYMVRLQMKAPCRPLDILEDYSRHVHNHLLQHTVKLRRSTVCSTVCSIKYSMYYTIQYNLQTVYSTICSTSMFILPPPTWVRTQPTFDKCATCGINVWCAVCIAQCNAMQCNVVYEVYRCRFRCRYRFRCSAYCTVCSVLPVTGKDLRGCSKMMSAEYGGVQTPPLSFVSHCQKGELLFSSVKLIHGH